MKNQFNNAVTSTSLHYNYYEPFFYQIFYYFPKYLFQGANEYDFTVQRSRNRNNCLRKASPSLRKRGVSLSSKQLVKKEKKMPLKLQDFILVTSVAL